jgi:hypothetical protein
MGNDLTDDQVCSIENKGRDGSRQDRLRTPGVMRV